MELIHVAHRQEAFTFFEKHKMVPLEHPFEGTYHCDEGFYLLISGEGIPESISRLSTFLGQYFHDIKHITNLGVAGSLHREIEREKIYSIRTCYAEEYFKSFSFDPNGIDLVTSRNRVLDEDYAQKLYPIAPIVDRELWAVGQAAYHFHCPVRSFKLISDHAGKNTDCLLVRQTAEDYSLQLYHYWQQHRPAEHDADSELKSEDLNGFYFTHTQKHQLKKLLSLLAIKRECSPEDVLSSIPFDQYIQNEKRPKERSKHLIHDLEIKLTPMKAIMENEFNRITLPLRQANASAHTDQHFDSGELSIQFRLKNAQDLERAKSALEFFNWKEFSDFSNGKFEDV